MAGGANMMTQHPTPHHPHPGHPNLVSRSPTAMFLVVFGALVVIGGTVWVLMVVLNRAATQTGQPPQNAATQPALATAPADEPPQLIAAKKVPPTPQVTAPADTIITAYSTKEDAYNAANPGADPNTRPTAAIDPGYVGKIIEVTGRVYGVGDSELVGIYVALGGGVERTRGVRCLLAPENVGQIKSISRGQTVVVRGRCKDLAKDIELEDCAIMKIISNE
jgi:hypothetical protein